MAGEGNRLLIDAGRALSRHGTIEAKIRQRINLLGHELIGSGAYYQQGSGDGLHLRLELRIQVADHSTSLLQVHDGRYLWIYRQQKDKTHLSRVDVAQIRKARAKRTSVYTAVAPGGTSLALGGLPALLDGLSNNFDFYRVEQREIGKLPVRVVRGRWRRDKLASLLEDQKDKILAGGTADLRKLPAQLPQEVVLYLGRDDLFPYLIEYRRFDHRKKSKTNIKTWKTIVAMEFSSIRLGAPISARQFQYEPGDLEVTDLTERYLKKLGGRNPQR